MLIRYYWAKRGVYAFDEVSGAVTRVPAHVDAPICTGAIWKQRGRWFALWHDGTSLYFQHKAQRWSLKSDTTFSVSGRYKRIFRIERNEEILFEFRYCFKGIIFSRIDPTYDLLDEEADDFFLYVVGMWRYWKDNDTVRVS